MTKHEASNLLDRVRVGDQSIPEWQITAALYTLGDMVEAEALPVLETVEA